MQYDFMHFPTIRTFKSVDITDKTQLKIFTCIYLQCNCRFLFYIETLKIETDAKIRYNKSYKTFRKGACYKWFL